MNEYRLSIDYGTTNTVAYLQAPESEPIVLAVDRQLLLPSAVWVADDRSLLTGVEAVNSARRDPGRYEPNPKRRIADRHVLLGGEEFPVEQLIGATLTTVYAEARRQTGGDPLRVVLTHPAAWPTELRTVLRNAAGYAGIQQPTLVTEPEAAAAYLVGRGDQVTDGDALIVYDLGAGTCDVTAVLRAGHGFRQLATSGLDNVGGLDLDEVVVGLVGRVVGVQHPDEWGRLLDPEGADRWNARMLWEECRTAKELLTTERVARVHVPLVDQDVMVTRADFEREARPLLQRTVEVTEEVLRKARVSRDDQASLFLVGGATRTPLVGTMLNRTTSRTPGRVREPELVVAEGALHMLAMERNEVPRHRPQAPTEVAEHARRTPQTRPYPAHIAPERTMREPALREPTLRDPLVPASTGTLPDADRTVRTVPTVPAGPTVPASVNPPPIPRPRPPATDRRKLIPNPHRYHLRPLLWSLAAFVTGFVVGKVTDSGLFTALGWLLLVGGAVGLAWKLFDWVTCTRDTRPTTIDPNGVTVTLAEHETIFPWDQIGMVYLRRHRGSRWLVCTPATPSTLGSDHRTAVFWSQPYNVFFLTSVSGFGEQTVRDALERYAGDRYRG